VAVSIGPFGFAMSHIIFFLSVAIVFSAGWLLGRKLIKPLSDPIFRILAVTLIAARFGYVVQYFDQYSTAPWQILNVRDGGFLLWIGLGAGVLMFLWEAMRARPIAPRLALALMIGALSFFGLHGLHNAAQGPAPDLPTLALETLDGREIVLSEAYRGKPTVFNLWATWCPPCVKEMPILQDAQNEHSDLQLVIVNQGESPDTIIEFLQANELTFTHNLRDPQSRFASLLEAYVLPTTLFFNAEGMLVDSHIGELSPARLTQGIRKAREVQAPTNANASP